MAKSTYLRNAIYNAILRNTSFQGPATVYLSLHTADPALTGANEVTGNAYARIAIAFPAPAGGSGSNSGALVFPAPTPANWGTVTHVGFWDALTNGNFLEGQALTNQVATSIGVPVDFAAGGIVWSET